METLIGVTIRALEFMFLAGWAGTLLVLLLSGLEDTRMLFEKDEPAGKPEAQE